MKTQNTKIGLWLLSVCFVLACLNAYGATTIGSPNIIRFAVTGDTYLPTSNPGASNTPIETVAFTPLTTGSVYRLRDGTLTGKVLWETTATETRPVTALGTVVTAVGGLQKQIEKVVIQIPTSGLYFECTDSSTTGLIVYRRSGSN